MKLLWLSAHTCNGNVHSFFNYPKIEQFLEDFEFIYHPSIEGKYTLFDIFTKDIPCDILLIDGTLEKGLKKFDIELNDIVRKYASKVKKIVTVGTCATFGGVFLDYTKERYGFLYHKDSKHDRFKEFREKTISISGCPIHPETLANTLYAIKKEYKLHLDEYLRPKEFYGFTIHNGCLRNEYFEYKVDGYEYGNLEGCLYYDHGCQAPYTHGSCNRILWNETSSKTRSGHPCLGCTEPNFPKDGLYVTKKNMGIPENLPLGVPKRTYLTFAGMAKAFKIDRFRTKIID